MPLTKKQKETIVEDIVNRLSKNGVLLLTTFSKISVEKIKQLRKDLKGNGIDYKVIKKSLLDVAFKKAKIDTSMIDMKNAPETMGVVFGNQDQIAPVRSAYTFAKVKENATFTIIGGMIQGNFVSAEAMAPLARVSSMEELYARLLGQLQAPLSKLVYAVKAIGDKKAEV